MEKKSKEKKPQLKSSSLVGLFTAAMVTFSLTGCGDKEVEYCYDFDKDYKCDDDGSFYDPDSYIVIDGKKEGYIKYDDSDLSSGSGG